MAVLKMAERFALGRKTILEATELRQPDSVMTVYECSRCNDPDQLFKLWVDGRVTCGSCEVRINITTKRGIA